MPTGKVNNIFVIDIDDVEHWKEFLKEHKQKEPNTVKAISGSCGIHLYFEYSEDLDNIKSNSKCFGAKYNIDIQTNGGCIIIRHLFTVSKRKYRRNYNTYSYNNII